MEGKNSEEAGGVGAGWEWRGPGRGRDGSLGAGVAAVAGRREGCGQPWAIQGTLWTAERLESGAQSGAAWRTLFSSGGPGIPDPPSGKPRSGERVPARVVRAAGCAPRGNVDGWGPFLMPGSEVRCNTASSFVTVPRSSFLGM